MCRPNPSAKAAAPGGGHRVIVRRKTLLVTTEPAPEGNDSALRATIPEGNTVGQHADVDVGPSHRGRGRPAARRHRRGRGSAIGAISLPLRATIPEGNT